MDFFSRRKSHCFRTLAVNCGKRTFFKKIKSESSNRTFFRLEKDDSSFICMESEKEKENYRKYLAIYSLAELGSIFNCLLKPYDEIP